MAVLFSVTVLFTSCSTKKSSFTHRLYHNTTAKYNGYFNGNESLKDGVAQLSELHEDDYTKILQIYRLGTPENATSMNSYFDKAYTKASVVIQRHSIFIKKKEHIKWIPESFLLVGKSYFYKQDYKLASESFDYVIKQYSDFPTKYAAMLWQAKTYILQKKYSKAESMLDMLQNKMDKNSVPKKVLKEFPLVYADYHIKQGNYEQAIEYVMQGIDKNKKKSIRVRLTFILAQIYQKNGNLAAASKLYASVIKMNPAYIMAFNAKINMAMCYDPKVNDIAEIQKMLGKMAKETKNKDYLDQIYYAMAELSMKEPDTTSAIKYYKLSAEKSVANKLQKATSYLKLANLYFSIPDYENASMFYDSTMAVLPTDYSDYEKISNLQITLAKLVTNIKVVELEDSLQLLSKLPQKEIYQIIDGIITDVIKEEQKKQEELIEKQQNIYNAAVNTTTTTTAASWYFYNSTAVNFGKTEFVKKWGSRKLEDLWRLSNKQIELEFSDSNDTSDSSSTDSVKTSIGANLKDRNYYYNNIPFTTEQIKASDAKIIEALYNIGLIYENDLNDLDKSRETFEKLMSRFPDNTYQVNVWYHLYLIYESLANTTKTEYYKNLVCTKEPTGDFCKLIKDPTFGKTTSSKKSALQILYQEAYTSFKKQQWDSVSAKADKAVLISATDTTLVPKFLYLKAIGTGKTKDSSKFVAELKNILEKYPDNSITPMAQTLYDLYTGKVTAVVETLTKDTVTVTSGKTYAVNEEALHFYVVVLNIKNIKVNDLKNALSDYNTNNFPSSKLTISNIFLDNNRQIITVTHFENQTKAMLYYNTIKKNEDVFSKYSTDDYLQFVISVDNYPGMYKNKDVESYYKFFLKNYQK